MARAKKQQREAYGSGERVKRHEFTRDLVCELTREEVENRSQGMATAQQRREELEGQFDAEKKAWKGKIGDCAREVSRLSGEIISHKTVRPVKCQQVMDFANGEVLEVRLDTKEVISQRPISAAERQKELDFDGDLEGEFSDSEGDEKEQ